MHAALHHPDHGHHMNSSQDRGYLRTAWRSRLSCLSAAAVCSVCCAPNNCRIPPASRHPASECRLAPRSSSCARSTPTYLLTYIPTYIPIHEHLPAYIRTYIHNIAYIRGNEYMQLTASVASNNQTHTYIPTYIPTYILLPAP